MDELKKKASSVGTDENMHDALFNLRRLNDGYGSVVEKLGCTKFKPYLHRLFQSVEVMLTNEITEFKKIDAKYQDIVRQCHIYEKTLSLLKESNHNNNNFCEMSSFSESSNTYAMDDFTKVTPFLAPDLLQSTLGANNGGNTSGQFRLPHRRSSILSQHFISTPLGIGRSMKTTVPIARFDDECSFALSNSLGFQPNNEKKFVDASTDPEPETIIEKHDFSCQMIPISVDQEVETNPLVVVYQSIQTETIPVEDATCQVNPQSNDCSMQTMAQELIDFSAQFMPSMNNQTTETLTTPCESQTCQTESASTMTSSTQVTIEQVDKEIETIMTSMHDIGLQLSINNLIEFDDQEMQTDLKCFIDAETQYESEENDKVPDISILPIVLSEDLPVSHEVEISIQTSSLENMSFQYDKRIYLNQECQTIDDHVIKSTQSTQTKRILLKSTETQSTINLSEDQSIQTDANLDQYSSTIVIVPPADEIRLFSSNLSIIPYENRLKNDQQTQCDFEALNCQILIERDSTPKKNDRRSIIQQQLDEKEKQMNRIIEEYAMLYGEYESERRRNMDLTEARDRLADHIKILSDELEDREINQEKLLIKSCQQNKLINYMLPHMEVSPMLKKKHHSATNFRRLLPKFK